MSDTTSASKDVVRGVAWLLAILGVWFALQRWVLPALGCRT